MKFKTVLIICNCVVLIFSSCSKNKNSNPKPDGKVKSDVYAVGYTEKNNIAYATYWKNGVATRLSNVFSYAYSVVTSGNDVYIAGMVRASNYNYIAVYWKDGIMHKLTDSTFSSDANSIAVKDGDIYVSGTIEQPNFFERSAIYWKNGIATRLSGVEYASSANCIALEGNDVYIAGYMYPTATSYSPFPVYWKNNVEIRLDVGLDPFTQGIANAIVADENNTYIAGVILSQSGTSTTAYWKGKNLTADYSAAYVSSNGFGIAIKENDVYIVGDTLSHNGAIPTATCWKNGKPTNLANGNVGSMAHAIAFSGSDIYVGGFYGAQQIANKPFLGQAVYWKNGTTVKLSSDTSEVYSLAVVTH